MNPRLEGMTVDAVVAAALRHHGHDVADTVLAILDHDEEAGVPLFDMLVHVDLGHCGADGSVVKGFRWEPAGRYGLGRKGLRCVSLPITTNVRWAGPCRMPRMTGAGIASEDWGSRLVVDRPRWPDTVVAACAGRHVGRMVDHPWIRHPDLVVKGCTLHEGGRFASLWIDEVLVPIADA